MLVPDAVPGGFATPPGPHVPLAGVGRISVRTGKANSAGQTVMPRVSPAAAAPAAISSSVSRFGHRLSIS
ncbi:hypothetical protein GCM10010140_16500 [Streptosporangium pseudovulgare]|uniref:Uncharacterized protein n=1 Tax=Streptosporangium pseudovulgare TaxID=35765 RepID=A0ABQ2QPK5_9ACTN|nr:hypothetical protein GCM10010140_16500 [Streptosporangium pseudovulgare]